MAGRGRPKGSAGASFLGVHLGELNRVLKEDAVVLVSRKYSDMLHIEGKGVRHLNNNKHIEAVVDQPDFKIDTGEDNDENIDEKDW